MKKVNFIMISALLLSIGMTGCGESQEQIIVETLPAAAPVLDVVPTTEVAESVPEIQEETQEEVIVPAEYSSLMNDFEFQDCLNMIISPKNPLHLAHGSPKGYAIGKPFRLVIVYNTEDGFEVEADEMWQFPVIASGRRIIASICAYGTPDATGKMKWKHFSATEGIASELTETLSEYEAFALFTDGTDKTHSGIIYGITPKNKTITIAQNSSELVALLKMDDTQYEEATEDPVLAQRISAVHRLRGERETQPFQSLEYHDVWGFNNTVNTKLLEDFIYVSPDYKEDVPPEETLPTETDTTQPADE